MPKSLHIAVCTHQDDYIYGSEILRPIIVGAANMGDRARILQAQLESKIPKKLRLGGGQAVDENAPALTNAQSDGVCDFGGFQGGSEGIVLRDNEQAPAADSRKSTQKPMPFILRDDSGDNISVLNPNFCELTAMYWAWKNVDASYYGLFHYRRVLDFSGKINRAKDRFDVNRKTIAPHNVIKTFKLDEDTILSELAKSPIILANSIVCPHGFAISHTLSQYDIYARDHRKRDLDIVIDIIRVRFPHLVESMESVLFVPGTQISWCNMFIMRNDLYDEYCGFLFAVLLEARKRIDLSGYNSYQARIYGFLGERLLNIFVRYKMFSAGIMPIHKNYFELKMPRPFLGTQIIGDTKRIYAFGLRIHKSKLHKE